MTSNRREYNPVTRTAKFALNSRSSESENWSSFVCGWSGLDLHLGDGHIAPPDLFDEIGFRPSC